MNTGIPFLPDWSGLDDFLENLDKISDDDRDQIIRNIKKEEIDEIVKECPNMKSPGLDGLTYEFYRAVWDVIGTCFVDVLQLRLHYNLRHQIEMFVIQPFVHNCRTNPNVRQNRSQPHI